jgi:hypothetical protein
VPPGGGEKTVKTKTFVIGIILACGGLSLALIGAFTGLFFAFRNIDAALSTKIDALFAAIESGTFSDTYSTLTAPELRKVTPRKEWEQLGLAMGR